MTPTPLATAVEARLRRLDADGVIARIWDRDPTVWSPDPAAPELADRLGWLDLPATMDGAARDAVALAADIRRACDRVVLCGMGGSSLAPEVLWRTFGARDGYPKLVLLDSTHPAAVRAAAPAAALARTTFLIASKSGTTIETASFEEYFWERTGRRGAAFIAVTDPDTALATRARTRGYRTVLSPPDVGGRFSALSPFGLVPAALVGIDPHALLARGRAAADACRKPAAENAAARLGVLMAEGALQGRDKLTLLLDDRLASFGLWVEQLVAESTGKHGRGVLPVVGEWPDELTGKERDRVFVLRGMAAGADAPLPRAAERLATHGGPVDAASLDDPSALAAEFFRWEFATAVAGAVLEVNPFDQPNVAESKANTARVLESSGAAVPADPPAAVHDWIAGVRGGDYAAVMAYLPPSPETDARLATLRRALARRTGVAVTVGYGPRFLHSTGQLHKGGPPRGHFLQIVDTVGDDLPIPGAAYGFGRLIAAQADGDREALQARGRPVLRVADFTALLAEVEG
jgi:Phosphoglucose isomerase